VLFTALRPRVRRVRRLSAVAPAAASEAEFVEIARGYIPA
jgi:hypothetical protein